MAFPPPSAPGTRCKRKFTEDEDRQIIELVNSMPRPDWRRVADALVTRSARQCRERWRSYLQPDLTAGPWTPDEDEMLKREHSNLGPKWAAIALFLPGRSEIQVKNRWLKLTRHPRRRRQRTAPTIRPEPKAQPPRLPPIAQLWPGLDDEGPRVRLELLMGSQATSGGERLAGAIHCGI